MKGELHVSKKDYTKLSQLRTEGEELEIIVEPDDPNYKPKFVWKKG